MVPERLSKPIAQLKGVTRKVVKGRLQRKESAVTQKVRAIVKTRDGDCRMHWFMALGPCGGESEWAHLEEKKRARTRGMPAAVRHTTDGSMMLCSDHHKRYDAGEITIEYLTTDGADGQLVFSVNGSRCNERRKR